MEVLEGEDIETSEVAVSADIGCEDSSDMVVELVWEDTDV